MTFKQIKNPNPSVKCRPGWCLAYVKDAFNLKAVYPSATAAWNASETKHRNTDFPENVWLPLWFSMVTEPLGHVVLRAPDGSIYSTSDNSTTAKHHPNLNHLMEYYAYYGMPLTYLGWTEDVEGQTVVTPVITANEIEDDMKIITLMKNGHEIWATEDFISRWHLPEPNWIEHYRNLEKEGWIILRKDGSGNDIHELPLFGAAK